jgi:predicted dehydrogenase
MNRRQFLLGTAASTFAFAASAAENERKLRVGVIGHTGRGDYGHGLDVMWLKVPETEIVAVADLDAAGLAKTLEKLKVTNGFADYREMLAKIRPDIVAVGARHIDQHRDMLLAAIEAGARGIYLEKPFCRTLAEADEILAAADRRKVKIALAHRNRYHPALSAVERLVKEDAIGRLLEIRCRGKEDARGGALDLWVLGSHLLNLAVFFAGKPVAGTATILQDGRAATKADVKDGAEGVGPLAGNEVHARFEMERRVPVFFDSVVNAGVKTAGFGLQLVGTKGIIDLRIDTEPLAQLLPGNPFQPVNEPRTWTPITSAGLGQPEPIADLKDQVAMHLRPARDLIAAMREDRPPICSAADGRVTVEMITAVFESHRLNGQRVTFPLTARQNPLAQLA